MCWSCVGEVRIFEEKDPHNLMSVHSIHDKISDSDGDGGKGCSVFQNHMHSSPV